MWAKKKRSQPDKEHNRFRVYTDIHEARCHPHSRTWTEKWRRAKLSQLCYRTEPLATCHFKLLEVSRCTKYFAVSPSFFTNRIAIIPSRICLAILIFQHTQQNVCVSPSHIYSCQHSAQVPHFPRPFANHVSRCQCIWVDIRFSTITSLTIPYRYPLLSSSTTRLVPKGTELVSIVVCLLPNTIAQRTFFIDSIMGQEIEVMAHPN